MKEFYREVHNSKASSFYILRLWRVKEIASLMLIKPKTATNNRVERKRLNHGLEAIVPSRDREIDEWQPKPNEIANKRTNQRTNEQSPFLIKPNLFHNFKSTYNDFRNRKFYDYIRAYDIPMPTSQPTNQRSLCIEPYIYRGDLLHVFE